MTNSDELPAIFHRQMSLVESRRRSSAVQELRKQNAELLAHLKVAQKRRLFAGKKNLHSYTSIVAKVRFLKKILEKPFDTQNLQKLPRTLSQKPTKLELHL